MAEVGSFDAKTHLPNLLRRVEQGETITITRRGKPIARLVPVEPDRQAEVREAVQRLKVFRRGMPVVPLQELLEARHAGHPY